MPLLHLNSAGQWPSRSRFGHPWFRECPMHPKICQSLSTNLDDAGTESIHKQDLPYIFTSGIGVNL